jgi:hypothetical protein
MPSSSTKKPPIRKRKMGQKGGMTGQITDLRTTDGKKGWAISRD